MNFEMLMSAYATLALLAANITLSIMAFGNVRLIDAMVFDVGRIRRNHEYHRMIAKGFIHGDPAHLLMNMMSLVFVGPPLEYMLGTWSYLALYMACLFGGSAWTLMEQWRNTSYRALGASGAISGVLAAFSMFAPFALFFDFIPAIIYTGLYIAWSVYAQGRVNSNIGHEAHLGGALTGVALVCIFWPIAVRDLWNEIIARLPT